MKEQREDILNQVQLEKAFSKNCLIPRLKEYFLNESELDVKAFSESLEVDVNTVVSFLIQMYLHKRCPVEVMAGILRNRFESAQDAVDFIMLMISTGVARYSEVDNCLIVVFEVSKELESDLELFQYPLPLIVKPAKLKSNTDTGYLSDETRKGSLILKNNHHWEDINLDVLNRFNSTPLRINLDTANAMNNTWKSLKSRKEGESREDYNKKLKDLEKFNTSSKLIMKLLNDISDECYLTHKVDKRGRIYAQGYHVNYQGTEWNRAVVEFANKEVVEMAEKENI